jgi:hypothetical protein
MSDIAILLVVLGIVTVVFLLRNKKEIWAKGPWFEFRARDDDFPDPPDSNDAPKDDQV